MGAQCGPGDEEGQTPKYRQASQDPETDLERAVDFENSSVEEKDRQFEQGESRDQERIECEFELYHNVQLLCIELAQVLRGTTDLFQQLLLRKNGREDSRANIWRVRPDCICRKTYPIVLAVVLTIHNEDRDGIPAIQTLLAPITKTCLS